jgi:hypothetical protein
VIQNVAMRVDGNKLVIEVDLSKEIGASSSGKGFVTELWARFTG